jgi:hypothetical protein
MFRRREMNMPSLRRFSRAILKPGRVLAVPMLLLALLAPGCSNQVYFAHIPPMIPINYYNCTVSTPADLYSVYLAPNARKVWAEQQFNNVVFVFKNVEVVPAMLEKLPKNNIWVGQVICYAVNPDDISRLVPGKSYDIVGVNRGVHEEWRYSIYLTECYFVPAESLALPVAAGPAFVGGY